MFLKVGVQVPSPRPSITVHHALHNIYNGLCTVHVASLSCCMYSVHYIIRHVHRTRCCPSCTLQYFSCTMCHARCAIHLALCTMFYGPCPLCHVPWTMHVVQCSMHHTPCEIHLRPSIMQHPKILCTCLAVWVFPAMCEVRDSISTHTRSLCLCVAGSP